jgi:hypothetical protein
MNIKRILCSCAYVVFCSFVLIHLTSGVSFTQQKDKDPIGSGGTGIMNTDSNVKTPVFLTRTLLVKCDKGVTGEPNTGTYNLTNGSQVNYDYKEKIGFTHLQVRIDNLPVPPKGIIIMNGNHQLAAATEKAPCQHYLTVIFLYGNWRLTKRIPDSSAWYACGTIVEYAYESDMGPVVEIDGAKVCYDYGHHVCAGTIVMDKNHTISIGCH